MRRPAASACLTLLLLTVQITVAGAQTAATAPADSALGSNEPVARTVARRSDHSVFSRVATGVGAAIVGAWVGFFMSQVAVGDWDQAEGHGRINRATWAGIGGALGFGIGFSFPIGGKAGAFGASSIGPSSGPGLALPGGRAMITAAEIQRSGAQTAYDLVKNLRPDWLAQRQGHSLTELTTGVDIRTYLDSQLLGGINDLVSVSAQDVSAIYRFDASQAATRWGAGTENGAILVVTKK